MISVLILTFDEAINLQACIDTIPWRDDIHILDSHSADETVNIAKRLGVSIHTRQFDTYSRQRNFGLSLPFRHDWILMLDADERLTSELADEIRSRLPAEPDEVAGFRVRRKDMFMGRWLRRSSGYPTWFPRLFRKGRVTVKRDVNEEYEFDGTCESLSNHLIHFPFNKGLEWWFARHNLYSTLESETLDLERKRNNWSFASCFVRDPLTRRTNLKQLTYRLPCRPALIFMYLYVFRLGFLDGKAGLTFASLRYCYEIMISAKMNLNNSK